MTRIFEATATVAAMTRGKTMKTLKALLAASAMMIAATSVTPAAAQESSYKYGTVWQVSELTVLPGQFENYMDFLATTWKKVQELGKAEGVVVEYHVLTLNDARKGEPNVVLVVEYKDYQTTAQQESMQKKVNALLGQDLRTAGAAAAARGKMREPGGSQEYQEVILK